MFGTILQRTIFWELVKVFALSLVSLTGLLLLAGVAAEAMQRGLTPTQILALIPLLIPSTLPYTIPTTTLFATSLVYGRLAHDNEIVAIKAAGINLLKIVGPCVFLGAVMSVCTMTLYYRFIPATFEMVRTMFLKDVEEVLYTMLRRDRCINHPKLNYAMFVHHVQGRRLIDALFKRRDAKGHYDIIARAREAELRVDVKNRQLLVRMKDGEVISDNGSSQAYFENRTWEVPLPSTQFTGERQRASRELAWEEIYTRRDEVAAKVQAMNQEIADTQAEVARQADPPPEQLKRHLLNLTIRLPFVAQEINFLNAELQLRPAISLSCLCFVLIGCPVGIWFSRSDHLSAFITCFLPIVVVYYPLLLCGTNLAKEGWIHPAIAVWAADLVMGVVAVGLFRQMLKH